MTARYPVHTAKALEAILWLANARPGLDIYHVVKSVYFADRLHINAYGRPIFGEDYQADKYGPLGATVYGLLTGSPLEQLALGCNGKLPFKVGDQWVVTAEREANGRMLSASDIEMLSRAVEQVAEMSFDELVEVTHDDPAYRAADGGRMRYEDMLDGAAADVASRAADLDESSRHAAFLCACGPAMSFGCWMRRRGLKRSSGIFA